MSELEQEAAPVVAGPTVGEMLRDARQRLNLDAADVARQLRLGLRQIEALEANDFAALPGNTIVRGFIRNYAKLLHADAAGFLAAYEASLPVPAAPRITAEAENIDISAHPSRRWLIFLLAGVALVIGVPVAMYALLHDDSAETAAVSAPAAVQTPALIGEAAVSVPLPAVSPVATVPLEGAETPVGVEPAPQAAEAAIQLAFDEDAWVEIRDSAGQRVYSQIGRKGSSAAVAGKAPFALVIGNAAKVRIIYKGKAVDLQPFIKVNVARLTLE
jgi:cytoskeleton protein RodZ